MQHTKCLLQHQASVQYLGYTTHRKENQEQASSAQFFGLKLHYEPANHFRSVTEMFLMQYLNMMLEQGFPNFLFMGTLWTICSCTSKNFSYF